MVMLCTLKIVKRVTCEVLLCEQIYFERLKLEKEEGRGLNEGDNVSEKLAEKRKKFNEVHGFSTVLNLINLLGLTAHAWHLAHRLWL
jgi:hypothetical protein